MKKLLVVTLSGIGLCTFCGAVAYAQGLQGLGDAVKKDVNTAVQQEVGAATGKALGTTGAAAKAPGDDTGAAAGKGAADDGGGAMKGGSDTGGAQGGGAGQGADDAQ